MCLQYNSRAEEPNGRMPEAILVLIQWLCVILEPVVRCAIREIPECNTNSTALQTTVQFSKLLQNEKGKKGLQSNQSTAPVNLGRCKENLWLCLRSSEGKGPMPVHRIAFEIFLSGYWDGTKNSLSYVLPSSTFIHGDAGAIRGGEGRGKHCAKLLCPGKSKTNDQLAEGGGGACNQRKILGKKISWT